MEAYAKDSHAKDSHGVGHHLSIAPPPEHLVGDPESPLAHDDPRSLEDRLAKVLVLVFSKACNPNLMGQGGVPMPTNAFLKMMNRGLEYGRGVGARANTWREGRQVAAEAAKAASAAAANVDGVGRSVIANPSAR